MKPIILSIYTILIMIITPIYAQANTEIIINSHEDTEITINIDSSTQDSKKQQKEISGMEHTGEKTNINSREQQEKAENTANEHIFSIFPFTMAALLFLVIIMVIINVAYTNVS